MHVTAWAGMATGLFVLWFGDWRKFALKYMGVALSTASIIYLLAISMLYGHVFVCHDAPDHPCLQIHISLFMKNLSILCFHITSGRDAIRFKRCDRRFCVGTDERQKEAA